MPLVLGSKQKKRERSEKCLIHHLEYIHDPIFLLEAKTDIFGECTNIKNVYSFAVSKIAWSERV